MEKIILVHYINIGNMVHSDVERFIKSVAVELTPKEDNIISYWIPIKNGETRIECINPKLVSEEDYSEAKKVLDRNQEIVNEIIKWKN